MSSGDLHLTDKCPIISIIPSLMPHTWSIARLCPLSLSQLDPAISLHALAPVKPHPLTRTGPLASHLCTPICSSHTHWSLHKCTLWTCQSPVQNHSVATYCSQGKYPWSYAGPSPTKRRPASLPASSPTFLPPFLCPIHKALSLDQMCHALSCFRP